MLVLRALDRGPLVLSERDSLAAWAGSIGASAGATYLREVFDASSERKACPPPPWNVSRPSSTSAVTDATSNS